MKRFNCVLLVSLILFGLFCAINSQGLSFSTMPVASGATSPTINDFWINNTMTGNTTQFAFNVSDAVALKNATFSNDQGSGSWANSTVTLSGTTAWANYTLPAESYVQTINFTFWVWNTAGNMTSLGYQEFTTYSASLPFLNLGTAITTVEGANDWGCSNMTSGASGVDPYEELILNMNTTSQYESLIDSLATNNPTYSGSPDYCYQMVLKYCAESQKLNLAWADKENDILWALGNITMCGSLPVTDTYVTSYEPPWGTYSNDFSVENVWALYGYYYAVLYGGNLTQWNITAAYNQFDAAVNYSNTHYSHGIGPMGLPLYIFNDSTGETVLNRYYDEQAETIDTYMLFYALLNVTDALNKAIYWWDNLAVNKLSANYDWSNLYGGYFKYNPGAPQPAFECEAGFFFKITSILKYYVPNLQDYSLVLQDIGNRFLSQQWSSYQWLTSPSSSQSTYVVVHMDTGNTQTRMGNTLAAWQALLGAFILFNSTYQSNFETMLAGNTIAAVTPAWTYLFGSTAGLWNSRKDMFCEVNSTTVPTSEASAEAEILLFMMGIVPQTSTIAWPLEELGYEYIYDIDPVLFQLSINQTARQITLPVVQAGTITFQYGSSPITYSFSGAGVYRITFTPSWNMISSVTLVSSLPTNLIYFYVPPPTHAITGSSTVVVLEGPYYTRDGTEYWIVELRGKRPIRLISNYY